MQKPNLVTLDFSINFDLIIYYRQRPAYAKWRSHVIKFTCPIDFNNYQTQEHFLITQNFNKIIPTEHVYYNSAPSNKADFFMSNILSVQLLSLKKYSFATIKQLFICEMSNETLQKPIILTPDKALRVNALQTNELGLDMLYDTIP